MANKSFVIQYLIKARDGFSSQARKVSTALKKVEKNTNKVNKANSKLNKAFISGMKRMGAAAVAFGGVALSAMGFTKLLTVGQRFQDSMLDLGAITGATGKDFEYLTKETMKLAKSSVTHQDEVAKGMAAIASAKPELLDNLPLLAKTTEQILLLKNASGMQFADAARVGAESLNIFGKSAEHTAEFVNILAAGSKFGSSMIAESGEAVVLAGGMARNAGVNFLSLNAAIQVAAKGGFKGARAGTALQSIFSRLSRTKGVDFKVDGLEGTFKKIKNQMDRLPNAFARTTLATKLFGEEHSKVGFALLNNVSDLSKFEKVLKGTNIAQEQADRRMTSFSTKIRALSININSKLIAAFMKLEPVLNKYAADFGKFIDSVNDTDVNKFVDNIKSIAGAVDTLVSGLASLVRGYQSVQYYSEKYNPFAAVTKLARDKVLGTGDMTLSDSRSQEIKYQMDKQDHILNTPADNFRQSIEVGVNVGLDQGLKQTSDTKMSPFRRGSANVGMTTNPA